MEYYWLAVRVDGAHKACRVGPGSRRDDAEMIRIYMRTYASVRASRGRAERPRVNSRDTRGGYSHRGQSVAPARECCASVAADDR